MVKHPFEGAVKKKHTKKHRPAVWECFLGTVFALNDQGECKYFDYDWDKARKFAGVSKDRDPRLSRASGRETNYIKSGDEWANPRKTKMVLWVLKKDAIPADKVKAG